MSQPSGHYSLRSRPTSPIVLFPYEGLLFGLPTYKLHISVEINVSTAFVKMVGKWLNVTKYTSNSMFVLPTEGTVTKVHIEVGEEGSPRRLSTIIVDKDVAQSFSANPEEDKKDDKPVAPGSTVDKDGLPTSDMYEDYIPGLFRLPIANVGSKEYIKVTCWYMEPLPFFDRMYQLTIPLRFNDQLLPAKKTMADVLAIDITFNSVSASTKCKSPSHKIKVVETLANSIKLKVSGFDKNEDRKTVTAPATAEEKRETKSIDFRLSYTLNTDSILPTMVVEEKGENGENGDENFLLFVSPPSIKAEAHPVFKRELMFLLDRSGSMTGTPYEEAIRALSFALDSMKPSEKFNICAFDDTTENCFEEMVEASKKNVIQAKTWLSSTHPDGGLTDIMTPLGACLGLMEKGDCAMPVILLITDGCVIDERDICRMFGSKAKKTRIATLAIGKYANWFFLKMLAQIGHGFSDVVVYSEQICSKVVKLMKVLADPLLTNIELDIPGMEKLELLPNPIPDLFMGRPLNVSGVGRGTITEAGLRAVNGDGVQCQLPCTVKRSSVIPVSKVLLQQRIELLTAKAWLDENNKLKKEVVKLSCANSIPSAYTSMILLERDPETKDDNDIDREDSDSKDKSDDSPPTKDKSGTAWYYDKKKVAAAVGGGALVVGAMAFSFGDVGGTDGNLSMLMGGGDDVEGCCDCECDECGDEGCCDMDCVI